MTRLCHWRGCSHTRFIDDSVSHAWQLRWDSHLNPLCTHILLAFPYLGLTAAKGNNVCQESVKLEPKPTLLFKSQVPISFTYSQAYLQCQTLISQLIQLGLYFFQILEKKVRIDSLTTLHRTPHHEKVAFIHKLQCTREGELTAELVSKIPWSEARDVWLKLGL